jgi:hypothetical protein
MEEWFYSQHFANFFKTINIVVFNTWIKIHTTAQIWNMTIIVTWNRWNNIYLPGLFYICFCKHRFLGKEKWYKTLLFLLIYLWNNTVAIHMCHIFDIDNVELQPLAHPSSKKGWLELTIVVHCIYWHFLHRFHCYIQ